jgi:ribonuclease HI
MWRDVTRYDRTWMDEHLADGFTEVGWSGRTSTRNQTLDAPGEPIDVALSGMAVRHLGRDAVLVTYRSTDSRGEGHRASVWVRQRSTWRLAFHQGTPASS